MQISQPASARAAYSERVEDEEAEYLSGGTISVRLLNEGLRFPSRYISLRKAGLAGCEVDGNAVRIGAATTIAELSRQPELAFLNAMAQSFAGPAIRNMASVGGNLFARQPYGDFALCCLALDATVGLCGADGEASVGIEAFLRERDARALVTHVDFTLPDPAGWRYAKLGPRTHNSAAIIAVAARLSFDGDRIASARIALSGCGDAPVRSPGAEQALIGAVLDEASVAKAGAAAQAEVDCFSDAVASACYRHRVLPQVLREALLPDRQGGSA